MPAPTTTNVERPAAAGYGCRLNSRLFRLAAGPDRELRARSAEPQAQRLQTSEVPEEFVDEYGQTFARSDFSGGEGLQFAHDRTNPPNASSQFWDSRNIDVSAPADGSDKVIRLLHTTERSDTISGTVRLAWTGTALYATDGQTLSKSTNPTATTPTWAAENPHAGEGSQNVLDVAALGSDIYAALTTNKIHRNTGGGWAHWSDLAATRIWGIKNRVMASTGVTLYEAAAAAGSTALKTIDPSQTFNACVDGGAAILAGASDGYVYAFTPTGTAGALELAAQDLFQGEQVVSLAYAQGLIFVGTAEPVAAGGKIGRLWRCELSSAFTLTSRQLVRQWGDVDVTIDRAPYGLYGTRDAVYAVVREDGSETHSWRYDLATAGLVRWFIFSAAGVSRSVLLVNGRLFAGIDASGVWRQTSSYAPSGWLIGPAGDFYSASDKTWVAARLDADVDDGEKVTLQYSTQIGSMLDDNGPGWANIRIDTGSPIGDETVMSGVTSRYIIGQVVLTASPAGTSPTVRSFGFRAFPADYDVVVQLPINVSDQIERHNRRARRVRGRGLREYLALLEFEGIASTLEVFELGLVARGQIAQIDAPVAVLSERGSVTQFAMAVFRGRRVAEGTGSVAESGTVGGHILGSLTVGGGV